MNYLLQLFLLNYTQMKISDTLLKLMIGSVTIG